MLKLAPYACTALFLLLFLQVLQAWANHTVVNPDLKLPALGRYYEGDMVTILMDFSLSATGIFAAIGSLFYWRQKNSRTRPIIHWEYFQERVS
ncbi:MAG: hypothetical protein ACRD5H_01695, partial [Nitrososphaerales archaeon]